MDSIAKAYEHGVSLLSILQDVHKQNNNADRMNKFLKKHHPSIGKVKRIEREYNSFVDDLSLRLEESLLLLLVATFEEHLGDLIQLSITELTDHLNGNFDFSSHFQLQQRKFIKERPRGLGERYQFGLGALDKSEKSNLKQLKEKRDYLAHGSFTEARKIEMSYDEAFNIIKTTIFKFSDNNVK